VHNPPPEVTPLPPESSLRRAKYLRLFPFSLPFRIFFFFFPRLFPPPFPRFCSFFSCQKVVAMSDVRTIFILAAPFSPPSDPVEPNFLLPPTLDPSSTRAKGVLPFLESFHALPVLVPTLPLLFHFPRRRTSTLALYPPSWHPSDDFPFSFSNQSHNSLNNAGGRVYC